MVLMVYRLWGVFLIGVFVVVQQNSTAGLHRLRRILLCQTLLGKARNPRSIPLLGRPSLPHSLTP